MAKKEKGGDGAKVPVRHSGSEALAPRMAGRSSLSSLWSEHPLRALRDEMDALFDRFFGRWPAQREPMMHPSRFWDIDVEEADKDILVRLDVPGFEPKDFDIHIDGNSLTIRAEHKEETQEKEGQRTWQRRYGWFERSLPLSTPVDADKAEARYHSGVLEVRLPRTEPVQRRRIEVKP
jgi:HSP20 family protein